MVIENVMYFALGLLAAGLLALIIMPAVWNRAVRLTKRRIEAATPITMAEFRADKDQLRAEFALTTRKLEMTIDSLRRRLAEQVSTADGKLMDLTALKTEREQHLAEVAELETRELSLRSRVMELERETTDLGQRLRMSERDLNARTAEVEALRESLHNALPKGTGAETQALSGDYDADIVRLSTALLVERKRAAFLEEHARDLVDRLATSGRRNAETSAAIERLREALAATPESSADPAELVAAEARLANAESTLQAILAEAEAEFDAANGSGEPLLAEQLKREDELEALRMRVVAIEHAILTEDTFDTAALRGGLAEVATRVSRLVYAPEAEPAAPSPVEESLFDRVQRFADEEQQAAPVPPPAAKPRRRGNRVSDRLSPLKEVQSGR